MLPFFSRACSLAVLVKSAIHAIACDFELLPDGTARVEPPRKPGIGLPLVWLGITNCLVTLVKSRRPLAPLAVVQQVYQAGP